MFGKLSIKARIIVAATAMMALVAVVLTLALGRLSAAAQTEAALKRMETSLRVLVEWFETEFDTIQIQYTEDGALDRVVWPEVPDSGTFFSHQQIDMVGRITAETATLFAWDPEEGDFIRRTTNITKDDGSRAVGTYLGRDNPVHAAMLREETYRGEAVILGRPYLTVYEPIVTPAGEVVGIFYVGVDRRALDTAIATQRRVSAIVTLGIAGVGALLMFLAVRGMLRPLDALGKAIDRMAGGDLESEVPHGARRDEVGRIAASTEAFRTRHREAQSREAEARARDEAFREAQADQARMVEVLRDRMACLADKNLGARIDTAFPAEFEDLRRDFNAVCDRLTEAIASARTVSETLHVSAREIGSMSDELAQRVESQAATLEQSAAAIATMAKSGRQIAARAEEADALAGRSRTLARDSSQSLEQTVQAMHGIKSNSDEIARIISVIDDIAFQTNLLALNAGVEAARAGEAGKGFAVVASEVRNLAQMASKSADDIRVIVERSAAEVREGHALVEQTESRLGEVLAQVETLGGVLSGIAEAVRDQATGLDEVDAGVRSLDETTQQNAAMVEESNAASQTLLSHAGELARSLSGFRYDEDPELKAAA